MGGKEKSLNTSDNRKRVTSITRKLHFHQIRKNTGIYVAADALLLIFSCCFWLAGQEMAALGSLTWQRRRGIAGGEGGELLYQVWDKEKNLLFEASLNQFLGSMLIAVSVLFAVQFACMWIFYFREDGRIRKILSPLDQLALRADELSRISFSEDKYQMLEEAITQIRPEDAKTVSLGDRDLQGVEAAMNNLLIRMRDTYRQQARFVNDASHELRTPIAVIQGYVNMLDRWGKEDQKILEESITAIRHEADHMNHLVEQLLFLARGDSGKTTLHLEQVDLNDMMQEVYEESFMIDENHVYRYLGLQEKDLFGKTASLKISADPGLLKQAVRILVDNAAKYTKAGDEILLGCGRTPGGEYYIQVQDTGIGMEEADVQHMFERFYRSDDVRAYDGTGLGLSIAKWIVDKHKGHFEILSRPGMGTRIRILL
ncbi:MAG: HAMP domain-containing histidine kinase [Blautia sp.]|nr:HAMP domain-containing histidine kinase [Blautia sp.]